MNLLEKDLEEIIYTKLIQKEDFFDRGLYVNPYKIYRQIRIGNYGVADLVLVNKRYTYCEATGNQYPYLDIDVFELKKDKIGVSAFLQCISYMKGIQTWLDQFKPRIPYKINGTLIGREIDTSGSFCYITSVIDNFSFYTYSYEWDGIKFTDQNYFSLKQSGFKYE